MNTTPKVLIVEDERALALAFAAAARQAGAASELAPTAAQARRLLREAGPFHALVLDIGLPDENGLAFLRGLAERDRLPTLVVTAHGEIENTIAARKLGVREFFTKPLDFAAFTKALDAILRTTVAEKPAESASSGGGAFLGAAPSMRPVFRQIAHACASTEPVLIRGETGTGKTRVARLIHEHSSSTDAGIQVHAPGQGGLEEILQRSHGGTLLIEEVASLSHAEQVGLVRAMETGDGELPRLLATSTLELSEAAAGGQFRTDLFYRLQVLELRLPPLRERIEDLPALVDFFAGQLLPGRRIEIPDDVIARLAAHEWPGNLRELRNVVSFALTASAGGGRVSVSHLPPHLEEDSRESIVSSVELSAPLKEAIRRWLDERISSEPRPTYRDLSESLESGLIGELLPRYGGRLARLATDLRANRATLRKRLRGQREVG